MSSNIDASAAGADWPSLPGTSEGAVSERDQRWFGAKGRWALLAAVAVAVAAVAGAFAWGYFGALRQAAPESRQAGSGAAALPASAGGATTEPLRPRTTLTREARSNSAGTRLLPVSAPLQWPIWEFRLREPLPPRDPPLTPATWRLLGATSSAGQWQLLVLREGKAEPDYFKVGEKLPGGYQITAITEEETILRLGQREVVLTYIGSR